MTESDQEQLLAFFKAMANESRLKLVGLLAQREHSVQELAQATGLTEPTVSHHLAVLKEIGLVSVRAEGVVRWHSLVPKALSSMNRALLDKKRVTALAPRKGDTDARVLSSFVDADGKLVQIPANRTKRLVILKWLAREFDEDARYLEREVNASIQRHHWDSATLRRELIGHRMLAREKGVYWRLPESEWKGVG
jgi:hypothetical protein